jgi:RNA polymerase sigma-70 factor, ECF subfamily
VNHADIPEVDDFESTLVGAQAGLGWAFEALFAWLGAPVASFLRARRVEDPDDLANEVFLRAFRTIRTFRGDADRFRSWMFTIARNAALDDQRRTRRRPRLTELGEADPLPTRDIADDVVERLARDRVESLIAGLPPDQRDVFLLRVLGDLSIAQTAAVLDKSYEAVKALQRRGAANLTRLLAAEGVPK